MINPALARSLFALPVRPLLVETSGDAFDNVLGVLQAFGLRVRNTTRALSMIGLFPLPARLIEPINDLPGVRAVHADEQKTILLQMATPDLELVWPTSQSRLLLGSEDATQDGFTGESIKIGVIDTGVDPQHPQLQGTEWDSVILVPREPGLDAGPTQSGHGSHVASTVGGTLQFTPTGLFVEGVSKSPMFSVQALGRIIGTGFSSEIVNAISLAFDRGVRVINMSLGSSECQGGCEICPECRAIKQFTARGVLFAVAAGNSGPDVNTINCPGCVTEAITVAAVDKELRVANFSSRGGSRFPRKPDVAAPGVDIFSGTGRGSQVDLGDPRAGVGFASISGTSMATPHIAGLLGILLQKFPNLTAEQFKQTVRAKGTPFNAATGNGVPNWNMFE